MIDTLSMPGCFVHDVVQWLIGSEPACMVDEHLKAALCNRLNTVWDSSHEGLRIRALVYTCRCMGSRELGDAMSSVGELPAWFRAATSVPGETCHMKSRTSLDAARLMDRGLQRHELLWGGEWGYEELARVRLRYVGLGLVWVR
jgi:hypothetical protein